jgi:hypothetical protein
MTVNSCPPPQRQSCLQACMEDDARHGAGQCSHTDRRTGRPVALCHPRQLMACLGLVPSEHSSGASIKRDGLTKAGNSAARRLLIEASWTYRFPAGSAASCCCGRRSSPSRSARSPGKRSCGCARAIASSPAAANRPMSSLPRSPASWSASSGPSPGACRRQRADRKNRVIASKGGASEPFDTLLPGKAGGAAAARITLDTTICRISDPMLVASSRGCS